VSFTRLDHRFGVLAVFDAILLNQFDKGTLGSYIGDHMVDLTSCIVTGAIFLV
jgi:hypothetical protein